MRLYDAMLAAALQQTMPIYHKPLVSGEDLNAITTTGVYRSATSAITKALLNAPSVIGSNGFVMEVLTSSNAPTTIQRITWGTFSALGMNCIIRCGRPVDGVMSWGEWYTFTLTSLAQAASQTALALDEDSTDVQSPEPSASA